MSNIIIRPAQKTDQAAVAEICFLTSPVVDDPRFRELVHLRWATPYILLVTAHCFVAVDADAENKVIGYILCALDTVQFEIDSYQHANPPLQAELDKRRPEFNPVERARLMLDYSFEEPKILDPAGKIKTQYPAHLHIDILPAYQRQGLGHRLMDRLIAHLRDNQVKGMHLWVDAGNQMGINFYEKYGFKQVRKVGVGSIGGICFGLEVRLADK